MKCVLLVTEGERLEGAEQLRLLGYQVEPYPTTRDDRELADTRVEEWTAFIGRHPATAERPHVRSLRASFIRMLEDSRYAADDFIIFGESDAFPMVEAGRLRKALNEEMRVHPETQLFRLFHHAVWNPCGAPGDEEPLEFENFQTPARDANTPYVWGTHAMVVPQRARKAVAEVFRTCRLPTDIALEAANSKGELRIRVSRRNLFYQSRRTRPAPERTIAACLSSYKRTTDLQRQIWCMMDQSYPHLHVFVAVKGMTESAFRRLIEPQFAHFVSEGRLTMRLFPNGNQLTNFVDTVRGLDLAGYDLFAKIDDDDFYDRDYFRIANDFHRFLPDDYGSFYRGRGPYLGKRGGVDFASDGWFVNFGSTLIFGRTVMQKLIEYEQEPERFRELGPRAAHGLFGYHEDALMHLLMARHGCANRSPYVQNRRPGWHVAIQRGNASVMRGGLVDARFQGKNLAVAHGREHEERFLELKHPRWHDVVRIVGTRASRAQNGDEASVEWMTDNAVVLRWDNRATESFVKDESGVFRRRNALPVGADDPEDALPPASRKVALLCVATGKKAALWAEFHRACRRNFLPDNDVRYCLLTDAGIPDDEDTTVIAVPDTPGIMASLRRFETLLKAHRQLQDMDDVFFLDPGCLPVARLGAEILPSRAEGMTFCLDPFYFQAARSSLPYEQNGMSEAFVHPAQREAYVSERFFGGRKEVFWAMCREISEALRRDLANGILASRLGESHLNKYVVGRRPRLLSPSYLFPASPGRLASRLRPFEAKKKIVSRAHLKSQFTEMQ